MGLLTVALTLAKMRMNQWKSGEELESLQERKLEKLVRYAAEKVPHYRRTLKGREARTLDEFRNLPMIRREDLRDMDSFISSDFRKEDLHLGHTSGSTGVPLRVYMTAFETQYASALRHHCLLENGAGPLDQQAYLTISSGRSRNFATALGLFRREYISYQEPEEKIMRMLRDLNARILISNPSNLIPLAMRNERADEPLRMKKIFTIAQTMTAHSRELISKSFGCGMSDRYGATETGTIAWECDMGSLHICDDSMIVEVVDDEGNPAAGGKSGTVVVTPLWRYSTPLIRYSLGDRAALSGKCPCGRGLKVLKGLQGRDNDFLLLPSGRMIYSAYVGGMLKNMPHLLEFQTIQEARTRLLVRAVTDRSGMENEIKETVLNALPERMEIDVEIVQRIARKREKLTDFVSKVKVPEI